MEDYKKKWEDAIEGIKDLLDHTSEDYLCTYFTKDDLRGLYSRFFPEIQEDKDENIRKELIRAFQSLNTLEKWNGIKRTDIISWLSRQGKHMTPKWLYRLEYKDSSCGLWYNGLGKWCFEEGIGSLDGCKTKELPMDYDERYKQDGRDWFSSCSQKEDLMHWYSLDDAKKLLSSGFVFTRYLATEYHEYDQETVFIKETSLCREEIDIFDLFGEKECKWSSEDESYLKSALWHLGNSISNGDKSDLDTDLTRWMKNLKTRVSSKAKEELSKKDKEIIQDTIKLLEEANHPERMHRNGKPIDFTENINCLKNILNND